MPPDNDAGQGDFNRRRTGKFRRVSLFFILLPASRKRENRFPGGSAPPGPK